MNVTIRQLEVFAATARAASFTEAAVRLGISQPALSETIRRIEHELGLRLFERTTRKVMLTAEGLALAGLAEEVVRDVRLGLKDVVERTARRPRLAIALLPSLASALLPAAVDHLRAEYPLADLSVFDVLHERAGGLVMEGVADMAVTMRPSDEELTFEALGADLFHLVTPRGHKLAGRGPLPWARLAGHPFVALAPSTSVRRMVDNAMAGADLALAARYEVEQIPSAVGLVRAGLGITALPAFTFAMFDRRGLALRPLHAPEVSRALGLVMRKGRTFSPAALRLAEGVRRAFRQIGAGVPGQGATRPS